MPVGPPCQGGRAGSIPAGRSYFRTWESLEFRVPRAHEIAGSNPAVMTVHCGGFRAGTGRRLLIAPTQVRFLPPQLCALGRAAKVPGFQPGEAGSTPAGHSNSFGDRLTAGCRALNPVMQVQILLPEPFRLLRGRLTVGRDAL